MFLFLALQTLLVVLSLLMAWANLPSGLLFSGLLAIPLYGAIAVSEMRRERFYLSPLVVYFGMGAAYAGIAPLWAYACFNLGYKRVFRLGFLSMASQISYAESYCMLGVLSYYIGYKLVQRTHWYQARSRAETGLTNQDVTLNAIFWVLVVVVSWLVFSPLVLGEYISRLGAIMNYISLLPMIAMFLIMTSRARFEGNKFRIFPAGPRLYIALGVGVYYFVYGVMKSGMRHPILFMIILFLWGYILQREKGIRTKLTLRSLRTWILPGILMLIASLLILIVIMPFGKQIAHGEGFPTEAKIVANLNHLRTTFPTRGIWQLPFRFANTSLMGVGACLQLREMRTLPDHQVASLVAIGLVPRIFWPNKPFISQGAKFSALLHIGGGRTEQTATSATGMTAIGELYWSYGPVGIIIGMALMGAFFAFTYEIFSVKFPLNPFRAWITAHLIMTCFMWFESEATTAYLMSIFLWVVFYPLSQLNLSWMRSKEPRSHLPSSPAQTPLPLLPGPNGAAAGQPPLRLPK